ncbi:MAG: iron-sulfur cluster assembly protein [Candidatus Calescibacterium sp.]|nr:iron-sulfur cluster assembly protein [Candidatus Calescibacterium sp.]MCX7734881.1 iron-sulfur cluster assembly protein [bacterium]MDW8086572.1 iron-sulfur cluster assembly protein [Candidatus Calescibacterium sp.]
MITKEQIIEALKGVYDPEIGIDIVNLGLVYDVNLGNEGTVDVKMTLTTPGCPLGGTVQEAVRAVLESIEGIKNVNVEIVWDPPWNPAMMSDEAKQMLGIEA